MERDNLNNSNDRDPLRGESFNKKESPNINFDKDLERRKSESAKWHRFGSDVIPMFVADMDFECPVELIDAIYKRLEHRCLGYATTLTKAKETIQNMLIAKYNWSVGEDSIVFLPGLVSALSMAARMSSRQNQSVIVPTPCYPPFIRAPQNMDCNTIELKMDHSEPGKWSIDIDELYNLSAKSDNNLFLCNPHNPTGHVFRYDELVEIANWAINTNSIIISDEIHAELILERDLRHIPIASLDKNIADQSITLMSPSKTFNIAGIGIAFAIIPNSELRLRFEREGSDIVPHPNIIGYAACEAAYNECEEWRGRLLDYLRVNREIVCDTLAPYRDFVSIDPPEATYLAWLDFSKTGWQNPTQEILLRAKVALGDGLEFHMPYHSRLTFGCPQKLLIEGLKRITDLLDSL